MMEAIFSPSSTTGFRVSVKSMAPKIRMSPQTRVKILDQRRPPSLNITAAPEGNEKVQVGGRRQGADGRRQGPHGRGKDPGYDEARHPRREVVHDEAGKYLIEGPEAQL